LFVHTIDYILNRRSIKKFKPDTIPWDNIVSLLRCGINAPVAGNIFNTKFIVVRDPNNRKAIAKACYDQLWMAQAPVLIVLTAEPEHQKRYYGIRGEKLYTIQNTAAVAMSVIIGAQSLGISSCWVGAFDEERMRDVMGLPEEVNVHVVLALGYADGEVKTMPKPDVKRVTYLEKWWAGRKFPGFGFYSENVMKGVKGTQDAIKKLQEKVIGKKEEKK
jgi:nitroreductase